MIPNPKMVNARRFGASRFETNTVAKVGSVAEDIGGDFNNDNDDYTNVQGHEPAYHQWRGCKNTRQTTSCIFGVKGQHITEGLSSYRLS